MFIRFILGFAVIALGVALWLVSPDGGSAPFGGRSTEKNQVPSASRLESERSVGQREDLPGGADVGLVGRVLAEGSSEPIVGCRVSSSLDACLSREAGWFRLFVACSSFVTTQRVNWFLDNASDSPASSLMLTMAFSIVF